MPTRTTVKLISAEGYEFIIDYKAACVSNTIRNMLSSQGTGQEQQSSSSGTAPAQRLLVHQQLHLLQTHAFVLFLRFSRSLTCVAGQEGSINSGMHAALVAAQQQLDCAPPAQRRVMLCSAAALNTSLLEHAGSFTETEQGEVKFPEISTVILEKVCQYFYYKLRYQNS